MDFQRFFDAFEAQTRSVSALTQRVEELRISNLQLLQAVKKAERLPHILDPESKKLANRFREQALAHERETLRQQRAKKLAQIEKDMAESRSIKDPVPGTMNASAFSRVRTKMKPVEDRAHPMPQNQPLPQAATVATADGVSISLSTEDELSNTVIAKDRLDFFRQVGSGAVPGAPDASLPPVGGSLLDQVNLESPSGPTYGADDGLDGEGEGEELSVDLGANTTTGTGFYTNSTDILQYMRHSTNTITSMFTLQEEEEETESATLSTRQPAPGERQHLTRYLMEASISNQDDEESVPQPQKGRPWDTMMEAQLKAQAELGMKLQVEIRAQEERLRAQMQLFNQMRHHKEATASRHSPELGEARSLSRQTPIFPAVVRSDEDSLRLVHPPMMTQDTIEPALHSKFCKLSALVKGHLTRLLYHSDKVQSVLRTVKDTAECALYISENSEGGNSASSRRQDAYLHTRLVNQLQAALFEFHDIFFASTPSQRMALIAATRETRLSRQHQEEEEQERASPEREIPSERPQPRLSAATKRRIEMRQRGQLNSVVSPRFINRPQSAEVPPVSEPVPVRPATAGSGPPRSQIRVLRPLPPQQQQRIPRSRSLNAGPAAVPLKRGQPHRRTVPQPQSSIHVVNVQGAGKRMTRKVRAGPDPDHR